MAKAFISLEIILFLYFMFQCKKVYEDIKTLLTSVADRFVDSVTHIPLYPVGKKPRYKLGSKPGGLLQQSDTAIRFWLEKSMLKIV